MKKITYLFAAMVAALGFSSCNETWDDNPTLATHEGDPVENFLNTPVEANTALFITEDEISSLRRFKDDVKEVAQNFECGIGLAKFNDIKEGDIFEAFTIEEYRD